MSPAMPIFLVGLVLLATSGLLEIGRKAAAPKIRESIHNGVVRSIVWRKNSPPNVQERYLHGGDNPPTYARFYFMNITNIADVRKGDKPILEEIGPYTFTRHDRKLDVAFSFNAASVSFNEYYYFLPCPHLTNGSLAEDLVTTLNLPLIGAVEAIKAKSPKRFAVIIQMLARLIEGWGDSHVHGVFTTRTPQELLFGYDDPLLKRASSLIPGIHVDPRFALVRNMTSPEESAPEDRDTVATGAVDLDEVWQYRSWHGMTDIEAWQPPHVEKVRGSDGTQFRPGLRRGDAVDVWIGEAYRHGRLRSDVIVPGKEQEESNGVRVGGVPVLRFRPDPEQGKPDPRYYQEIEGLLNITAPMFNGGPGPQLFLSLPGYCATDEIVQEGVIGVGCDWQRHDVYIDVEPTTGVTLRGQKAVMLSSWYGQRYSAVDKHLNDTFLPVFWVQQSSEADSEQLARFRKLKLAQAALRFFDGAAAIVAALSAAFFGTIATAAGLVMSGEGSEQDTGGGQSLRDEESGAGDGGGENHPLLSGNSSAVEP